MTGSDRARRLAGPLVVLALVPFLALPLGSCGGGNDASAAGASRTEEEALATGAQEREARRVRVEPVVRKEMVRVLETTTVVESDREVRLFARSSGIAVEVLAEEGDRVEQGDVLARLDARELALAVRDAEVALEEAKRNRDRLEIAIPEYELRIENAKKATVLAQSEYERAQRLSTSGKGDASLISEQELERTKNALDNAIHEQNQLQLGQRRAEIELASAETAIRRAEVALDKARIEHANMEITAPIAGVVAMRSIKVGDLVTSGEPAYVITDPDRLRAIFYRPQRELALFAGSGGASPLTITATTEALPGKTFTGYIERTSPTIDPESGSFRVTARLASPAESEGDPALLAGMLVRLRIVTDRHPDALVVPKRALRREGDQLFLFRVEDGVARRVDVREGYASDELVEVLPRADAAGSEAELGLAPGTPVVVVGGRDLEDGAPVEIDARPKLEDVPAAVAAAAAEPGADGAAEAGAESAEPETTGSAADGGDE